MQLLDSCALPEAQFATLTVLLQLNDIYDSQHGNQNVSGLSSEKDERGESSHSLPPPEDGDQNSESRDTEGNHCEKNEDDEADKSAGSTNNPLYENEDYRSRNKTKSNLWRHPKRRTEPMTHAVLRESMTVISPTTLLPEGAHSRSMESLEIHLMQEFGFRDDFRRIGGPPSDVYRDNEESCDTIVDHDHGKRGESEQDQHDVENNLECDDGGELNGRNGRSNSRVRFHTDTKDGAMDDSNVVSEKNAPSLLQNRKMMEYEDTPFPFENQLAVKSYSPPSFHLNCSLGLTLFYVTVFVEDIGELSEGCNGIIQDGQLSIEKDTTKTLKHCAAVLLPNVSWQKTHSQFATASRMEGKRGGMVILTVGITGPAYDLYGASPVVANLPQRLRECVRTLSALNTVSPSHIVKLKDAGKQTEHRSSPQQQKHASPKRSFIKTKSKPSSYRKDIVTDPSSRQSHQPTSLIAYDHSYFRQLYRALLASLLNDDDGYLSSRNIAPSNSSDFGMPGGVISSHKIDGSVHSHQSSSPTIDSESSIPPNHDSGSSGGGKKKLFTFSRKRNSRTTTGYETGDSISSGTPQDNKNDASDASFPSDRFSSQVPKAAEIVERMSLQLEVLSLAEEDMALPLYSKYECSADMLSVGNVERKRFLPSTSPKVSLASHGGTTHVSGRFGKPAAPSDLSGFDFKPKLSSSRPHVMNSAGSVSGLSSTSLMGSVSDDASILTGNDTATTSKFTASSSSQSSVPTLSKSKRDLVTTSSRSLFVQRRKAAAVVAASPTRAGVEANAGPSKPPLFPHERQTVPMPLFDPFGVEQNEDICDDVSKEKRNDDNAEEALSIASVSTKDTAISGSAPPSPLSRINGTISNSSSRDGSDVGDEHSLPQEHGPSIKGPLVRLDVALALNEDLTCEYKKSKLSTLSVEGTLQVRVKSTLQGEYSPKPQAPIPFFLVFQDHFSHIKSLQENKKFVEHLTLENGAGEREFIYCVSVPKEEEFYPIVRYKCSSALRPVPIRVQSRVRVQGNSCRVALQISSNPQNPSDLAQLTIIMSVPTGILGETLRCNPPGGVWNDEKKVVLWCVSELGGGEKFQLQAMFDIDATLLGEEENLAKKLEFPVLARCQCSGAQLSAVAFEVTDMPDMYPAEVSKSLIRRFRVSHKEK